MSRDAWTRIPVIASERFYRARLELHAGAVLLASVADSLLPAAADDSQSNLGLNLESESLETRPLAEGAAAPRLRLETAGPNAAWVSGDEVNRYPLPGRKFDEALAWVESRANLAFGHDHSLKRRAYPDLPAIEALAGAPFRAADAEALDAVFAWYRNARGLLGALREREPALGEARVWPHHFDLGALLPLGAPGHTIGMGLSPGDESSAEPYFYCTPYPQPDASAQLPVLHNGEWRRGTPTMAWLPAQTLFHADNAGEVAENYLREAIDACRAILS